jgi:hypothetical protein
MKCVQLYNLLHTVKKNCNEFLYFKFFGTGTYILLLKGYSHDISRYIFWYRRIAQTWLPLTEQVCFLK